jgi:GrpB-like predicted nucleotidyltransferase (UPF0157 family)
MLLISTPTSYQTMTLVGMGAEAFPAVPRWLPDADLIAVVTGADPHDVHLAVGLDSDGDDLGQVWAQRIRPFETNLRTGRRAPRRQRPVLALPDPGWPKQANLLIGRLHVALGSLARRIDHIGSTSVPGLSAKDIIDIQIIVNDLATGAEAAVAARRAGFVHVSGEWYGEDSEGRKYPEEVVVDADPGRPVNVNIRPVADQVWRDALLFRDFLRTHSAERARYEEAKRSLESSGIGIDRYGELKMSYIREALRRASKRDP